FFEGHGEFVLAAGERTRLGGQVDADARALRLRLPSRRTNPGRWRCKAPRSRLQLALGVDQEICRTYNPQSGLKPFQNLKLVIEMRSKFDFRRRQIPIATIDEHHVVRARAKSPSIGNHKSATETRGDRDGDIHA